MIGKLRGNIDSYGEDWVIVDVNGVGYHVVCSTRTLSQLPPAGEAAVLEIETHVREDQIRLFGFATALERDWFRLLQSVQGVGTRVALAVLSTLTPSELANAIAMQDRALVSKAPGVGAKVAQRIVSELKDKAPAISLADRGLVGLGVGADGGAQPSAAADAVSALVNLGYPQLQAGQAVAAATAQAGETAATQELIRLALKELAP
ncbi:Holliday junction branch migration protein RuvA [Kaustia mangrovi]|uniref:Holliday junction branch migration complex subunit RuvA n=1 Tax=Kaustia mangrovi TaxID=2593653 RepID=A0A7S8C5W6_9HYPH|nr:Holliday junction branch migration protein RuvA [Kaustia mangrovi]QPC43942.1 Holliday junction branch migration protein RuvA [Kaustia mangrovi]